MRLPLVMAWEMAKEPIMKAKKHYMLLQKILQSGIEERVAIKSVNSILSLRTTDEIFSTLDLAMIDLQNASAKFLKDWFNTKLY